MTEVGGIIKRIIGVFPFGCLLGIRTEIRNDAVIEMEKHQIDGIGVPFGMAVVRIGEGTGRRDIFGRRNRTGARRGGRRFRGRRRRTQFRGRGRRNSRSRGNDGRNRRRRTGLLCVAGNKSAGQKNEQKRLCFSHMTLLSKKEYKKFYRNSKEIPTRKYR